MSENDQRHRLPEWHFLRALHRNGNAWPVNLMYAGRVLVSAEWQCPREGERVAADQDKAMKLDNALSQCHTYNIVFNVHRVQERDCHVNRCCHLYYLQIAQFTIPPFDYRWTMTKIKKQIFGEIYIWMNGYSVTRTTSTGVVRSWWWKIDMRHSLTLALPARVQVHLKYETMPRSEVEVRSDCSYRRLWQEYCSHRSPAQTIYWIKYIKCFFFALVLFVFASAIQHVINCTVFHSHIARCACDEIKKENTRPPHSWSYAYWRIRFKQFLTFYLKRHPSTSEMNAGVGQCAARCTYWFAF